MFAKIETIEQADGWLPSTPERATSGSAGYDLASASRDVIVLAPGQRALVPTGIKLALPVGYEAQIRSRSGLALKKGVIVLNAPGTIDPDYRGEIGVILMNMGSEPFPINRGDRIAQMVIARYERPEFVEGAIGDFTQLRPGTNIRGAGGFGSTGTKQFDVT